MSERIGSELANLLRERSLDIYDRAARHAADRGIILADSKFEFGLLSGGRQPTESLILIDEVLTPDSSRYWPADQYRVGRNPPSFDKQFVRDWLELQGWDKNSPPPELPPEIVAKTAAKYQEAFDRITESKSGV
jgi:phosphoribosylaminoimidazole-succinocarboxamide synthase